MMTPPLALDDLILALGDEQPLVRAEACTMSAQWAIEAIAVED
jgi:hypothetical protein